MIVIPDLFGSYQKGREAAIDANWKDLQNYESIESARHQNDAAALANLATMADFGKQRRLTDNQVTNSDLNTEYNLETQIGKLYNARTNNLLGEIQYNTIGSNIPYLYGVADANLETLGTNAVTNRNNAGTNYLNSQIVYDVTTGTFIDTRQAAYDAQVAKNLTTRQNAAYGPRINENNLKANYINSDSSVKQAQTNNVVTGVNAQYAGDLAHLHNQANLQNAIAAVSQGKLNVKTFEQALSQYDSEARVKILSSSLAILEQGGDTAGANKIRQMIGKELKGQFASAGGKGSIPILNPNGQQIGVANADGTVSRTSNTTTSSTPQTSTAPTPTTSTTPTTPTTSTGTNLFGIPVATQRQFVPTVNVVRPLGGQGSPLIKVPVNNQGSRNPTATDYAAWWGAF